MPVHTILLVDLLLDVEVDTGDDYVGDDVERAHAVQDIRVIERNLLGDLHKPPTWRISHRCCWTRALRGLQDDNKVGTARYY
jgi:hypothetical protein